MKKLLLFLVCAVGVFAADHTLGVNFVSVDDKAVHVQANGVRVTDTIKLEKPNMTVELAAETLQSKTNAVYNVVKYNVPSYMSVSLVKNDMFTYRGVSLDGRLGFKELFGPNGGNSSLLVFEPGLRYSWDKWTVKGSYETNTSLALGEGVRFNGEKFGVDYKHNDKVTITAGYEIYRGFLKRNNFVGGVRFEL